MMTRNEDDLDLVSAVGGVVGALEVAGRYALGGVRTARRRIGRVGGRARRRGRRTASRTGRRVIGAVWMLRGSAPSARNGSVEVLGAATAAAVLGAVAALGIRYAARGLVAGAPAPDVPGSDGPEPGARPVPPAETADGHVDGQPVPAGSGQPR